MASNPNYHREQKGKWHACSRCCAMHTRSSCYCTDCHSAYMRTWRKTHRLTAVQRFKDNARSYAGVYKRRGKLKQQPCEHCGSADSQMHHEDYRKPLDVHWLCRECHLREHGTLIEDNMPVCSIRNINTFNNMSLSGSDN